MFAVFLIGDANFLKLLVQLVLKLHHSFFGLLFLQLVEVNLLQEFVFFHLFGLVNGFLGVLLLVFLLLKRVKLGLDMLLFNLVSLDFRFILVYELFLGIDRLF